MILETIKPKIDSQIEDRFGRFIIEPLHSGYGITLGNSLRRVLLSSLGGTAVTSIKIEGVLHEFSTIKGVQEDTTEIILNIKKLRLKSLSEDEKVLKLEIKGKKVVTAKDITPDPEVEILNPDLKIATLTNKTSKLFMELRVNHGVGYVPADRQKPPEQVIGLIPIDSIFTPIKRVNYHVEATRVKHLTNYDRLVIEIWTDGSFAPREALNKAGLILQNSFKIIADFKLVSEEEISEEDLLKQKPIEELKLSIRSYNCLKRSSIKTLGELLQLTHDDLMKMKNFGVKSLVEIKEKFKEYGFELEGSEEE